MINDSNIWNYDKNPDKCPLCHSFITANKIHSENLSNQESRMIFRCTNTECKELFIAYYKGWYNNKVLYKLNPQNYIKEEFDLEVKDVLNDFIEIYNQALKAEWMLLDKIAGVWFRKALEFLIKDYAILLYPEESEQIKANLLWKVISEKINDEEIKEISKRAVWIWNDETHYVKKWETKDINDLKVLIDITQSFISKKQKAKKYLENMN